MCCAGVAECMCRVCVLGFVCFGAYRYMCWGRQVCVLGIADVESCVVYVWQSVCGMCVSLGYVCAGVYTGICVGVYRYVCLLGIRMCWGMQVFVLGFADMGWLRLVGSIKL